MDLKTTVGLTVAAVYMTAGDITIERSSAVTDRRYSTACLTAVFKMKDQLIRFAGPRTGIAVIDDVSRAPQCAEKTAALDKSLTIGLPVSWRTGV
jgi:hypothetical protein